MATIIRGSDNFDSSNVATATALANLNTGWKTLNQGGVGTGSSFSVTGFPSGTTEVWLSMWGVSKTNDNTAYVLRLGDSGGTQASGYYSHAISHTVPSTDEQARVENGTEFFMTHENNDSGGINTFDIRLRRSTADNLWTIETRSYDLNSSGEGVEQSYGYVTLSNEFDRLAVYPYGGNFDAGSYIARYV